MRGRKVHTATQMKKIGDRTSPDSGVPKRHLSPPRNATFSKLKMKWFRQIQFWDDLEPRDGPMQMAVDQALLEQATLPVLRVYRWSSPCVSIGYFESRAAAQVLHSGLNVFRRWTGGGLVLHNGDRPYSLIVPRSEPFARIPPRDSYQILHGLLASTLRPRLPSLEISGLPGPSRSRVCFENPVPGDLLLKGRKIAGAGQRRNRAGFLHQGSLLGLTDFTEARLFAQLLAENVLTLQPGSELLQQAARLHTERYGTESWNQDKNTRKTGEPKATST